MSEVAAAIQKDSEARMKKSLDSLKTGLEKIRTGRANASLLDHITVDYYGTRTPLAQCAQVGVADARTLVVTPWDKGVVAAVEKAIRESNLGLNPAVAGLVIRIPLPTLTEERRRELGKAVKGEGENAKIAMRNVRREANTAFKEGLKKKTLTEDDEKRAEESMQKMTDHFIADVDKLVTAKEQELMAI